MIDLTVIFSISKITDLLRTAHSTGSCVAEIVASTGLPILQSFMSGINAFEDFALGALIQGESPVYSLDFIGTYIN